MGGPETRQHRMCSAPKWPAANRHPELLAKLKRSGLRWVKEKCYTGQVKSLIEMQHSENVNNKLFSLKRVKSSKISRVEAKLNFI